MCFFGNVSFGIVSHCVDELFGAEVLELVNDVESGGVDSEGEFFFGKHRACVESCVHFHDGDACFGLVVEEDRLDRAGTAVVGEE